MAGIFSKFAVLFSPVLQTKLVITGFNTDIEYKGVTYHVQTEDKGVATPLILSLVYNRGTILASKRSPYDDLLVPALDEPALTERLQKQHKLMCAAVRAGRIEDLKRMTMKESAARPKGLIAQKEIKPVEREIAQPKKEPAPLLSTNAKNHEIPLPQILREPFKPGIQPKEVELDLPKAVSEARPPAKNLRQNDEIIWDFPIDIVEDEPVIEAVRIIEEEMILPAEAVEIITDFAKNEQTAQFGKLKIELPAGMTFKGGERKTVGITVRRGNNKNGLSAAHIMVKVLGAAFRPLIFHATTDSKGTAIVHLQLPNFKSGRAAILIKAVSDGEETELRRVIRQG